MGGFVHKEVVGSLVRQPNYEEEVEWSNLDPSILIPILFFLRTYITIRGARSTLGGPPLNSPQHLVLNGQHINIWAHCFKCRVVLGVLHGLLDRG